MFLAAFRSLSYTVNTIHCVHNAHIELSLAYHTLTEHSTAPLLAFHHATLENHLWPKVSVKIALCLQSQRLQFSPKMPHFAHKISGGDTPLREGRPLPHTPPARRAVVQSPRSSSPQFDPPLWNTCRGLRVSLWIDRQVYSSFLQTTQERLNRICRPTYVYVAVKAQAKVNDSYSASYYRDETWTAALYNHR